MTTGARTPEGLVTLLEDTWMAGDGEVSVRDDHLNLRDIPRL